MKTILVVLAAVFVSVAGAHAMTAHLNPNYAFEMEVAFRAEHGIILQPYVDPTYFTYVPAQFKQFEDPNGCLMIRVPEYPEGLYCDRDH